MSFFLTDNARLSEIENYSHIGLLLRETNLINGMLFGAESWYGVTNNQLDKLDRVDISYFRKLFNSSYSTMKEIYFLECGKIPLKHVLISRRVV